MSHIMKREMGYMDFCPSLHTLEGVLLLMPSEIG